MWNAISEFNVDLNENPDDLDKELLSLVLDLSMNFSKKSAKGALKAGMHYAYTEENSPIELSNIITYSFSEDCSNARMLSVHMYLKDVMGVNTGKWSSNYKLKGDLSFQKNACFIFANVEDNNDEDFPRGTLVNDGVKSND